jgi:hypothetical protein
MKFSGKFICLFYMGGEMYSKKGGKNGKLMYVYVQLPAPAFESQTSTGFESK